MRIIQLKFNSKEIFSSKVANISLFSLKSTKKRKFEFLN
jgi:hypothetical protein